MIKLIVRPAKEKDVYRDFVRVYEENRKNKHGNKIKSGKIGKVKILPTNKSINAILKGTEENDKERNIYLDESLREKLGVECNKEYDFVFEENNNWCGQLRLTWNATDPGYRISIRIAIVAFAFGVISILIGLIGILK